MGKIFTGRGGPGRLPKKKVRLVLGLGKCDIFRFMERKKEGISGMESISDQRLRARFMNIP